MKKIKQINVDERELEDLLVKNPEAIEEGMNILGRQIQTDSGPLDILASDADKVLTVIELKNEIDDKQLDQGLRYYDWVKSNIQWISKHFPDKVDSEQEPRLILIAPGFSENLKRIAKYVNVSLDLLEYTVIQLPDGEKYVLCKLVEIGKPSEPTILPTREGHLKRIENEKVRKFCEDCLNQLQNMGIEIRPIQNYWFSMWYKGKRFMYLGCKKKFFVCEIQRQDGSWTPRIRITSKEDWDKLFAQEIMPLLQTITS